MTYEGRAWIILAALAAVLGLALGVERAMGAPSLADPNDYLTRHGLHAPLVPFHLVPLTQQEGTPLYALGGGADFGWESPTGTAIPVEACVLDGTPPSEMCPTGGRHEQPGVWVSGDLVPLDRAYVALHEWLHVASFWTTWERVDCNEPDQRPFCERPFVEVYEEGLVEALTLHLLPGWWKSLVGRPLRMLTIRAERAEPGYVTAWDWLAVAAAATGTPRWSRASREQLTAWLRVSLQERVAVLA